MRQRASSSTPKSTKKIVILALDEKNAAGAGNVEKQLQQDTGAATLLINLFTYMPTTDSSFIFSPNAIKSLHDKITAFSPDAIYLCIHGLYEDVKSCYYAKFTTDYDDQMHPLCTAEVLGTFLSQILPKQPSLKLVMCFGARTADCQRNHISDIKQRNIFDSFAHRLFLKLALAKLFGKITLSGWVTEVSYESGRMQAEHENAYQIKQQKNLIADQRILIQKQIFALTPGRDDTRLTVLEAEHNKLLKKELKLASSIIDMRPKNVYGNLRYVFQYDQCTIAFHHENTVTTLYQGALKKQIPTVGHPIVHFVKNHPYTTAGLLMAGGLFYTLRFYKNDEDAEALDDDPNVNIL